MTSRAATFYELLGVGRRASPDDIRSAYRRRAQKFHPDKYRGRGDAAALMTQINRAYEVLSDPQQRSAYDQDIAAAAPGARVPPAAPLAIGGWPWYLMAGTICVCLLAIGWVALSALAPKRAVFTPVPAAAAPAQAQPVNAVAAPAIQPWTPPPPRTVPLPDDPVSRLVREGVVNPPAPGATR